MVRRDGSELQLLRSSLAMASGSSSGCDANEGVLTIPNAVLVGKMVGGSVLRKGCLEIDGVVRSHRWVSLSMAARRNEVC